MGSNQPSERSPAPPASTDPGPPSAARNTSGSSPIPPYSARWATGSRLTGIAIVLLLVAGVLVRKSFKAPPGSLSSAKVSTISTGPNERREVRLGDDAVATLAGDSRIRYAVTKTRTEVELTGAAQFDVARSLNREFDVRAGNAHVIGAGTAFIVRAYDGENAVVVGVRSGNVTLGDAQNRSQNRHAAAVKVAEGQIVSVSRDGRIGTATFATEAQYMALLSPHLARR